MKKTPRKFQAGGATPAPATKPAPKGGPKELQDEAEKVRQEKLDEAQRKAGQRRPDLSKPFKKGGAVRKFNGEEESFVDSSDAASGSMREVREDLRSGSPEAQRKEYMAKRSRPSTRRSAPKVASKPEPKAAAKPETKSEAPSESLSQGLGRKFAATESAFRNMPAGTSPIASSALKKARDDAEKAYTGADETLSQGLGRKFAATESAFRNAPANTSSIAYAALKKARDDAEKAYTESTKKAKGGVIKKYAKGGGVEAKGKTKGKIVKMATGGSVRGYGVSKVTNKTKYC
jgi:hypothetical protein